MPLYLERGIIINVRSIIQVGDKMKRRKKTFEQLMKDNKRELLEDYKMLEIIEERIEKRHMQKAE